MTRDTTSMLEKTALLLGAFTPGSALSLNQLSERTGLAKSTVHRLILDLHELGWVARVGQRYELGMAIFELGESVPVKHRLRAAALPFMQDLYAVTQETVHLAVRDGHDIVYAEKLHGHASLPLPSRTGGRAPLNCTAVGKALLAHETPAMLDDLLTRPLRRWTPRSIVDPAQLLRELESIRRTGVAVEREEATLGGACVAAPVLVGGQTVAALSVSVPIERFRPERLGPAVRTAALGLSRTLDTSKGA
ncbi:IclR family transcriptional regulator [Geodermatophilus sp. CPCC 206100]|uniref:IclR family transcriptional regulator n=1 Tax=Geodermatophilus sp. CPCC 206100 TaxID=3020054 RepID=UPI003B00B654